MAKNEIKINISDIPEVLEETKSLIKKSYILGFVSCAGIMYECAENNPEIKEAVELIVKSSIQEFKKESPEHFYKIIKDTNL